MNCFRLRFGTEQQPEIYLLLLFEMGLIFTILLSVVVVMYVCMMNEMKEEDRGIKEEKK